MRVEKLVANSTIDENIKLNSTVTIQSITEQKVKEQKSISPEVRVDISRRGLVLAQEMEAFVGETIYDIRNTLTADIDSSDIIDGSFVSKLAEKYKGLIENIKKQYSPSEYKQNLEILDNAYRDASEMLSERYSKQIRILSRDIVLNKTLKDYSSQEEAEAALEKEDALGTEIISEEREKEIYSDVKRYLEVARDKVLENGCFFWQDLEETPANLWNCSDLQKVGVFLLSQSTQIDLGGISTFANEIITNCMINRV